MGHPVIFFFTLLMMGQEPVHFEEPVGTLAECIYEVHEFMAHPPHEMLISGGQLQVGCATEYNPSVEH